MISRRGFLAGLLAAAVLARTRKPAVTAQAVVRALPRQPLRTDFHDFILRDYFAPVITHARQNHSALLALIPDSTHSISGKFITVPVRYRRRS